MKVVDPECDSRSCRKGLVAEARSGSREEEELAGSWWRWLVMETGSESGMG